MGYFALSKDETPEELIKAAIQNLELYTDHSQGQYKDFRLVKARPNIS